MLSQFNGVKNLTSSRVVNETIHKSGENKRKTRNLNTQMLQDLTFIKNGQAVTTDLIVAKVFNKTPTAVRRAITNLKCNEKFRASNFLHSAYIDSCGKRCSSYLITKDGFFLLSIRMNGKKTEALKIQYMDAFNQLDRNLNISIHMFNELC